MPRLPSLIQTHTHTYTFTYTDTYTDTYTNTYTTQSAHSYQAFVSAHPLLTSILGSFLSLRGIPDDEVWSEFAHAINFHGNRTGGASHCHMSMRARCTVHTSTQTHIHKPHTSTHFGQLSSSCPCLPVVYVSWAVCNVLPCQPMSPAPCCSAPTQRRASGGNCATRANGRYSS